MKAILVKIHLFFTSQLGVDFRKLLNFVGGWLFFVKDWYQFRKNYYGKLDIYPCVHDRKTEAGVTKSEYFWQDLLVASWIFKASPEKHVDIGSRVDGFVAHVASFRDIEVFDVRPINIKIPGIAFTQADFMCKDVIADYGLKEGYCDSISCLHAIEHFGLGRYGDRVDIFGHERGIANMAKLLKPSGLFYLSTPIGRERVVFNAHRIFSPSNIIRLVEKNGLMLEKFTVIDHGKIRDVGLDKEEIHALGKEEYLLGIFVFRVC